MFKWGDIEALNEALVECRDTLKPSTTEALRRLSLQIGMLVVANSQKVEVNVDRRLQSFPTRLRSVRARLDLTQEELGKRIGITKQSVYLYESGGAFPGLDTFARLCKALNTTPDYLLGWGMEASQASDIVEQAFESLQEPAVKVTEPDGR